MNQIDQTAATPTLLNSADVGALLCKFGFLSEGEPYQVQTLGGGVSNIVLRVETAQQTLVIKQSLPKLRVEMDWYADQNRIWRERDYLTVAARWLPANVPAILFVEPELYLLGMTDVSHNAVLWKNALMSGTCNPGVVGRAAQLLAQVHSRTYRDAAIAEQFGAGDSFEQLRIDPYLRTIARCHPDLTGIVDDMIAEMLSNSLVLVHGDYSPKNLFVTADGDLVILDAEVAHWGDPTFDVAFCLNHLLLKAVYHRPSSEPFLQAATGFWRAYQAHVVPQTISRSVEERLGAQLAALLLARVDGKSPVEYLLGDEERRSLVRHVARAVLARYPHTTFEGLRTELGCWLEKGITTNRRVDRVTKVRR